MEAYQLQSPSHRVGFQIFLEIEVPRKVKYERERMFCGAIDPYKRYNIPVGEAAANQRFLQKSLRMELQRWKRYEARLGKHTRKTRDRSKDK